MSTMTGKVLKSMALAASCSEERVTLEGGVGMIQYYTIHTKTHWHTHIHMYTNRPKLTHTRTHTHLRLKHLHNLRRGQNSFGLAHLKSQFDGWQSGGEVLGVWWADDHGDQPDGETGLEGHNQVKTFSEGICE